MTVKDRQCLLAFLKKADGTSYYTGEVDGIYGRLSRKAIQDFQKDFCGLTVTGEADAVTDQAIIHAVAFGISERDPDADPDVTDKNVGDKTGTFWDHIRYWSREEWRCQCGGKYCDGFPAEPDQTLVELVDDLRAKFGRPGHRTSGLRCEIHNRNEGGVWNSRHRFGKALDFFIEGVSGAQLLAAAKADPRTGYAYIIEGQYVHVDVE